MEALNQFFNSIGRTLSSLGKVIGMGVHPGRVLLCVIPVLLSAFIVSKASREYLAGEGGFRLGVDLSGGAVLVYEVDTTKTQEAPADLVEKLTAVLKRRIDPNDLYNITIRPIPGDPPRVEIILPTGGRRQVEAEQNRWNQVLADLSNKIPPKPQSYKAIRTNDLTTLVVQAIENSASLDSLVRKEILDQFIAKENLATEDADRLVKASEGKTTLSEVVVSKLIDGLVGKGSTGQKRLTSDEVERIKGKISQQGQLEFSILANSVDDREGIEAAKRTIKATSPENLDKLALQGYSPPVPVNADQTRDFTVTLRREPYRTNYRWVEIGKQFLYELGLNTQADEKNAMGQFRTVAESREKREATDLFLGRASQGLVFSRRIPNLDRISLKDRQEGKSIEYFLLVREGSESEKVTGDYLSSATKGIDEKGRMAVNFRFNAEGANRFSALTSRNNPDSQTSFQRQLAIILDQQIQSAPGLITTINESGQITGDFTGPQVDRYVDVLRSGALPATLKPQPVSETTMGPTLGEDTIRSGAFAILSAFAAVLLFMVIYYRVSGFIACLALFANLIMTVAFMLQVNAVFTLPGLAGLVLTLGLAVDANILIYERLREEQERGATIALALRNGYDRALPTIIDTHLSSIITSIILYIVGNDQLKGFGVSMILGLLISLFTSLTMTRVMFDIWMRNSKVRYLHMLKVFTNPKIDFMSIRKVMFTITVALTIIGAGVFFLRGKAGLNIDFNGGTSFTGLLSDEAFKSNPEVGNITWLRKQFEGEKQGTGLPEVSIEQIFVADPAFSESNRSRLFTLRTTEKSIDQVKKVINEKLGSFLQLTQLSSITVSANGFDLVFVEPVAVTLAKPLILASLKAAKLISADDELVVRGLEEKEGKAKTWKFSLKKPVSRDELGKAIAKVPTEIRTVAKLKDMPQLNLGNPVSVDLGFEKPVSLDQVALQVRQSANAVGAKVADAVGLSTLKSARLDPLDEQQAGRFKRMRMELVDTIDPAVLTQVLADVQTTYANKPVPERLENFDSTLAQSTQERALYAIVGSWLAIVIFLWFRFGNWTFGLAALLCLVHDLFFTLGIIALCHYVAEFVPGLASLLLIQDFKIDLPAVAALLTLVGYSVNDTIVVFDRIREVRGRNPGLNEDLINRSVNQTLSRTIWTSFTIFLVVMVLYLFGGEGVHLFAFIMVIGVIVGTYSSIFVASPLLMILGEGRLPPTGVPSPVTRIVPQKA